MTEEEYLAHVGVLGMRWGKRKAKTQEIDETPEQRRERVLKSTNAKELYVNRDVLSTAEITERMNRIKTEKQLAELSAEEKTAGQQRINKILKVGKTINDLYTGYKKPMVQDIITKLSGKSTAVNYEELLKNVNNLSNVQLLGFGKRIEAEQALVKYVQRLKESTGNLQQSDTNSDHLAHAEKKISDAITALDDNVIKYLDF